LRPQAFAALQALLQHSGHFVDYDTMIREAWHGVVVSRHTVAVTVGEVKRALQEFGSWISYRPRLGYRLEVPRSEDLIRQANHCWNRCTREGVEKALQYYRRAAEQDPADFRALEGISSSYLLLGTFGMRPAMEMYREFRAAHQLAVKACGMTPHLRSELGHGLHVFERRPSEAAAQLTCAYNESPGDAGIGLRLSMLYATMGRFAEALDILTHAEASEPLLPTLPPARVFILACQGQHEAALRVAREAVDLHPQMPLGRAMYADALDRAGYPEHALREWRQACLHSPDVPWLRAMQAALLARLHHRAEALAILEELSILREVEYVDAYFMAILMHELERPDAAFRELSRALEENSATLFLLDVDPRMHPLRGDSRFRRLRDDAFAHSGEKRLRAVG
jgi:tetratricopeptide (TPR) repeat protein